MKDYAVIETGSRQYPVHVGEFVKVEKLEGAAGDVLAFDKVLLARGPEQLLVGGPLLDKVRVRAEIIAQEKSDKLIVFKKKRRQNYRRKRGHRQAYTLVRVTEIFFPGEGSHGT